MRVTPSIEDLFANLDKIFGFTEPDLIPKLAKPKIKFSAGIIADEEFATLLDDGFLEDPSNIALMKELNALPKVQQIRAMLANRAQKYANEKRTEHNAGLVKHIATCTRCEHDLSYLSSSLRRGVIRLQKQDPDFQAAMKGEPATT